MKADRSGSWAASSIQRFERTFTTSCRTSAPSALASSRKSSAPPYARWTAAFQTQRFRRKKRCLSRALPGCIPMSDSPSRFPHGSDEGKPTLARPLVHNRPRAAASVGNLASGNLLCSRAAIKDCDHHFRLCLGGATDLAASKAGLAANRVGGEPRRGTWRRFV